MSEKVNKEQIDLSIIVPVHDIANEKEENLFKSAIESINNMEEAQAKKLLVVAANNIKDKVYKLLEDTPCEIDTEIIENKNADSEGKSSSFQFQVNLGVENIDTKYFVVLEFDDKFYEKYFKIAKDYLDEYGDEYTIFLPFIGEMVETDKTETGLGFIKYGNEILWAKDFSENLGTLDHDALSDENKAKNSDFKISGAIINKEDFEEIGGLKPSIKIYSSYEFFLRATNYDKAVISIPKIGYVHLNNRENSYMRNLINSDNPVDGDEVKFWFNTCLKEFYFMQDRNLKYEPKNKEDAKEIDFS